MAVEIAEILRLEFAPTISPTKSSWTAGAAPQSLHWGKTGWKVEDDGGIDNNPGDQGQLRTHQERLAHMICNISNFAQELIARVFCTSLHPLGSRWKYPQKIIFPMCVTVEPEP